MRTWWKGRGQQSMSSGEVHVCQPDDCGSGVKQLGIMLLGNESLRPDLNQNRVKPHLYKPTFLQSKPLASLLRKKLLLLISASTTRLVEM